MPTINCQSCGVAIKFPSAVIGPPITCPACKAQTPTVNPPMSPLTLPNPTNKSLPGFRPPQPVQSPVEDRMAEHLGNIDRNVTTIKSIVLFWFVIGLICAALVLFNLMVAKR